MEPIDRHAEAAKSEMSVGRGARLLQSPWDNGLQLSPSPFPKGLFLLAAGMIPASPPDQQNMRSVGLDPDSQHRWLTAFS
jgi:hypothetical protein